jgi:predicted CXXCH cytochrome family protein
MRVLALIALWAFVSPAAQQRAPGTLGGHPSVKSADDGAACLACHKKIASQIEVHAPVAGADCASCHAVVTKGLALTVALVNSAKAAKTQALCTGCHDDFSPKLKAQHVHEPAAAGDCAGCHDPHGSPLPFLLVSTQQELCTTCHDEIGAALKQKTAHAPAAAACTICHDPHGAPQAKQLRVGVNEMCRSCHATAKARLRAEDASKALRRTLADNELGLLNGAKPIVLDATGKYGHPLDGHPVTGFPDPGASRRGLSCVSCHNPHGTASEHLLKRGAAGQTDVCVECHK